MKLPMGLVKLFVQLHLAELEANIKWINDITGTVVV